MRVTRRLLIVASLVGFIAVAFGLSVTWPQPFLSKERALTGLWFRAELLCHVDDGSWGEGEAAWIWQVPERAAQRLAADTERLREYPMWSALAFDGYRLVRWKPASDLYSGEERRLMDQVFRDPDTRIQPEGVTSIQDAQRLASALVQSESAWVSAWYTTRPRGTVSNYFVYVLDLDQCLLVKLSLLT